MSTMHLTEDQIDDVLIGDASSATDAHLATCTDCSARVAALSMPIAEFASATLAWGERKSATMPPQPVTDGSQWSHKLNWALAAMVLVAAGFIFPLATRNSSGGDTIQANDPAQTQTASVSTPAKAPAQPAPVATKVAAHNSADEVARDNQMLEAIHDELEASVQSPADTFAIQSGGGRNDGRLRIAPTINFD